MALAMTLASNQMARAMVSNRHTVSLFGVLLRCPFQRSIVIWSTNLILSPSRPSLIRTLDLRSARYSSAQFSFDLHSSTFRIFTFSSSQERSFVRWARWPARTCWWTRRTPRFRRFAVCRPVRSDGTSTVRPSSSVPVRQPSVWPVRAPVSDRCLAVWSSATRVTRRWSSSCSRTPFSALRCPRLWVCSVLWWPSWSCTLSRFTYTDSTVKCHPQERHTA